MFTNKTVRPLIVLFFVLGISSAASAAEDPISEKKLVFNKFIQVSGAELQYNQMINIMVGQIRNNFISALRQQVQTIDDATPEKRAKLIGIMEDALERFVVKFKARMVEEMPFSELVDNVFYPVYEEHFNTPELISIITFYESSVGKKFVTLTPNLMQDTKVFLTRLYGPKLQELSQSIAEEEFQKIKPELEKLEKE